MMLAGLRPPAGPSLAPAVRAALAAAALSLLRRLHSGDVRDYIAWLVPGAGLLGIVLLAAVHSEREELDIDAIIFCVVDSIGPR